jgi:endoglucanase
MASYRKVVIPCILALAVVVAGVATVSLTLLKNTGSRVHAAAPTLPYNATANGPYTVKGNMILGANGAQYIFHGIGRDGLEYNCSGEGPLDEKSLSYMGAGKNTATETYWGANTVRLPVSEGFWLNGAPGYPCSAQQYQALVEQTVSNLTALHLNVMIDLQWVDAGGQSGQGGAQWPSPDADSITFWTQVATLYKGYSNVLFELYNEPYPPDWTCWVNGCSYTGVTGFSNDCNCSKTVSYAGVGMQALVNAVRATGASNLVIVGGMNWGYTLTDLPTYGLTGSNIVYDTHPYPYTDKLPTTWNRAFGGISRTYPVISAESGQYDCGTGYVSQLYDYLDSLKISWVAWAWYAQPAGSTNPVCGYPQLVTNYQGKPAVATGQYIYQRLQSYIPGSKVPTPGGSGSITVSGPTKPWNVQTTNPWKKTAPLAQTPVVHHAATPAVKPKTYNVMDKVEPTRYRKG